jgi:outer membrane immunogenic protein
MLFGSGNPYPNKRNGLGRIHGGKPLKKILVASIAAAAFMSAPAIAADMPTKAPSYKTAPLFDWTGFYVGGDAGYTWSDARLQSGGPGFIGGIVGAHPDPNGFSGGLHVGYRQQLPSNIVWGVEGDVQWLSAKASDLYSPSIGGADGELDLKRSYSARGVLGYAMDRSLIYATGGLAWMKYGGCATDGAGLCAVTSFVKTASGWTIGAGYAYAFTPNVIGRVEYLYADYGNHRSSFAGPAFGPDGFTNVDLTTSTIRASLSWKFDGIGKGPISAKY